jgi:hypothetical protein
VLQLPRPDPAHSGGTTRRLRSSSPRP